MESNSPDHQSIALTMPVVSRRQLLKMAGVGGASLALDTTAQAQTTRPAPPFTLQWEQGEIVSLKRAGDTFSTDYIQPKRKLGGLLVRYRDAAGAWQTVRTKDLPATSKTVVPRADGRGHTVLYQVPASTGGTLLTLTSDLVLQGDSLFWTVKVRNETDQSLEVGDLALPLSMNTNFRQGQPSTASVLKHSFISGDGSFLFWMRSNSVGPYLTMTPLAGSSLEYWDRHGDDGYQVFIHSAAAGEEAAGHGGRWRQPHTRKILASKEQQSYGFRFDWANDYEAVRQQLVKNGLIDVHVVPGMTVPVDLQAHFALRTKQKIQAVEAEFPATTKIEALGKKGQFQRYKVSFSQLGENRLTVRFGKNQHLYLEFFCTEPLETLIKKRGAFIARHQHRNTGKWYEGLLGEWNAETQTLLGPDNYDRIKGWRIYEVTCDDPGLSKPAYLAAKNAEYPVQSEIESLDYYLQHFVWGGLQRTTEESYPYGIYGIPDWKTNRESADPGDKGKLHLWRIYDYPHIILTYFSLYRVAKHSPHIRTALPAAEYLRRAAGTAIALFTVPDALVKWSAYETGLYNELVIVDLIAALDTAGLAQEAAALRRHWEKKVQFFVSGKADLFVSEYAFDSTGFESTHALAKYALERTGSDLGIRKSDAHRFLEKQMAANLFCRGCLEPAYYLLGSDYRATGGDAYTLSYMSQMGGWSILDYAIHFAPDPFPYVRLGFASYLSAWALMNTGTAQSDYGYWNHGIANDGAAGGGFEPASYGQTWLGQPHHRGSWYYSCEIDLGYCGALRCAATLLADDPIFGRFCFGGDWHKTSTGLQVVPKDGVRRRFHALLGTNRRLHLEMESGRFKSGEPIIVAEDYSRLQFIIESDTPEAHVVQLRLSGLMPGKYQVHSDKRAILTQSIVAGQDCVIAIPLEKSIASLPVTITKFSDT